MISFIVIGKNIANTIAICLDSIGRFVRVNDISDYETIYVDSDSTDNTISIAKKYPVRIFRITGEVNAAIGRNVGAKNARGDILYFIDGDMELEPEFWKHVYDADSKKLIYPFISGFMHEKYYDGDFNYLYSLDEKIPAKPFYKDVTGGFTIVEKALREKSGGMDERLIRNQDVDLGLCISKLGFPVLKVTQFCATHHTISYFEKNRYWQFLFSKALLSPGLLMRKHLFNKSYLRVYRRNIGYVFYLLVSIILLFFKPVIGLVLLLLYILLQLFRTLRTIKKEKYFLQSFIFKVLYNGYALAGFLFYFPAQPTYQVMTTPD
jgi:glycosyltransferase involved in cell wall biosynthesis